MKIAKHYLVTGLVQGVGFRRFVQKRALEHNLTGWVRNLDDGRVEALCEGVESDLLRFERFISKGPESGRVDELMQKSVEPQSVAGFEILPNGVKCQ